MLQIRTDAIHGTRMERQDFTGKRTPKEAFIYGNGLPHSSVPFAPTTGGCDVYSYFAPVVQQLSALSVHPSPNERLNMAFLSPLALISLESEKSRLHPPGNARNCWWAPEPGPGQLSLIVSLSQYVCLCTGRLCSGGGVRLSFPGLVQGLASLAWRIIAVYAWQKALPPAPLLCIYSLGDLISLSTQITLYKETDMYTTLVHRQRETAAISLF